MKQLFYLIILTGVVLTIQGCGNNGDTTGTISCSCPGGTSGHKAISGDIDFQDNNRLREEFIGFYEVENDCCNNHGRNSLTETVLSLITEPLNSSHYVAVYSSKSIVFYEGLFLPNQWTLQFWVNPSSSTLSGILMEESIGNEKTLFLSLTDDKKLSFNLPPSDNSISTTHLTIGSSNTLMVNTWQHIAITVSENDIAFYINGVLDKRQNFDSGIYNRLETRSSFSSEEKRLCFGSCRLSTGDRSFQGKVDNIEFINRVLSASEILSNYQASQSNFP